MSELLRVIDIVAECQFPGYRFEVCQLAENVTALRVAYEEADVMSGVNETQQGRWWIVNAGWEPGQIVQTCLKALLTSLEHRAREHFTWRGRAVLQPHFPLTALWTMADQREAIAEPIPFDGAAHSGG